MTIPTILFIVALILAIIDEFRAQGQSLTAWAVILIALGLLWGHLPG
jgi:uncharacterized membrane protein